MLRSVGVPIACAWIRPVSDWEIVEVGLTNKIDDMEPSEE